MFFSQKSTKIFAVLAAAVFFILSCSKTENEEMPDVKKSYYPINLNSSTTYQVDSTVYDRFDNSIKVYKFQIKDSVVTEAESGSSKTVYIERYKKLPSSSRWVFQKVITRAITDLRAEEFIENQKFVRFIFPPEKNRSWNGNTYNNLPNPEYIFKKVDLKDTVGTFTFDSTALVVQIDEKNLLREDYAEELYARNFGLVKKFVRAVDKDFNTQKVIHGSVYTMRYLSSFNPQ